MTAQTAGLIWALAFVVLEAAQFVFFGGTFQRMDSFLFGFLVLGLTVITFVGAAILRSPGQVRAAFANPWLLFRINAIATLGWIAYLGSVQLIEPAVAYTIGAGVMPLTAVALHYLGWSEGEALRNRLEILGNILIGLAILSLILVTLMDLSGFVRGGIGAALLGVALAIADGVLFTLLLVYCQRMDRKGVGPSALFGMRFMLYVLTAGVLAATRVNPAPVPEVSEMIWIIVAGYALIVPPLYALQRAVALISTLTLGTLTATGPFVIFLLQIFEGRVAQSGPTLIGLCLFFAGAIVAATGATRAAIRAS
ncbi:hypothetical protein [Roseovarius sp. 2305UL8-3]|uniref:hypothetical protein n=1 Tax=Roseovarius conchicola TaxID=3121636 RepID=UPI0035295590